MKRVIGQSLQGRPIEMQECGAGEKCALLFGAIHGDEPQSATLCERFVAIFSSTVARAFVVPIVNPDGLARGEKNNANDVDLNRNFPATSWIATHAARYFPGVAPLSEPESQALSAVIAQHLPTLIIAVHQPFACVNWDGPAENIAHEMSTRSGLEAKASVGYPTPGSFGSLYGHDRKLPVITLELSRQPSEQELQKSLAAVQWAVVHGVADGR